nr:uncharacterized protein LOC128689698 [Cherax quadricarinatus]
MATRVDPLVLILICPVFLSCISAEDVNTAHFYNNIPLPTTELYIHPYNFTAESSTPYPKTLSYILREKLLEEDRAYDLKVLANGHQVSIYLLQGDAKRLVFPFGVRGPLTITITPCDSPLFWRLSLRPHTLMSSASITTSYDTAVKLDSSIFNATEDPNRTQSPSEQNDGSLHSSVRNWFSELHDAASETSSPLSNKTVPLLGYSEPVSRSISKTNMGRKHKNSRGKTKKTNGSRRVRVDIGGASGSRKTGKKKEDETQEREMLLKEYEGHDTHQYKQRTAAPGLYVLQLEGRGGSTHVHVQASTSWLPAPPTTHITVTRTPTPTGKAVTLRWTSRGGSSGYCLAVSQGRPFPSLCAARAANPPTRYHGPHRQRRRSLVALGCTERPWFTLPHPPRRPLHVVVWAEGGAGPPLGRGFIPATPKRTVPRLKFGSVLKLVPSANGKVKASFRARKGKHLLHVMAVACGAKLRLRVESQSGDRVASAVGGMGALHLVVRTPKPEALILTLKTYPPGAANKVLLAAAHAARDLPLPRLPRNTRVRVARVSCSSATFKWSAAPGSLTYCLLLQEDTSGKEWRSRPPLQCGWAAALRRVDHYAAWWCGPPTPASRQRHTLTNLTASTAYIATVVVRHPATGHTLSFTPAHVTTHACHA